MNHHEDFSREHVVEVSTERSFGFVVAAFLLSFGVVPLLRGRPPRVVLIVVAGVLATAALAHPRLLRVPNLLWARLGRLLQRITNPIFLGVVFFGVLTPVSFVFRMAGKGILRRPPGPNVTYWKKPTTSRDMRDQF